MPHSSRMYDYWLGGRDNCPADRELGEMFLQRTPSLRDMVRENRDFVERATRFLTDADVRQLLDIGSGIPTSPNLHEVAQSVAPRSKVVHVDNDPIVLAHAPAMMVSAAEGEVAYVGADLCHPDAILEDADLARLLDLDQPVALMLVAVLMLLGPDDDPAG